MTSRTSAIIDLRHGRPRQRQRGGFTLVELLVVIGIIVVLVGLLMPMVTKSWRSALRVRQASDLQAIATALNAYRQDFRDIPRVAFASDATVNTDALRPNPPTGAQILCQALIAPAKGIEAMPPMGQRPKQDGADGYGFRTVPNGKVYPPYLPPDQFRVGDPTDPINVTNTEGEELRWCILDRNDEPILYFPKSPRNVNVNRAPAMPATEVTPYVDADVNANASTPPAARFENARYDGNDNIAWFTDSPRTHMSASTVLYPPNADLTKALKRLRGMLGDIDNQPMMMAATGPTTPDGVIQPYEKAVDEPYLLWSAGPDERFGPEIIDGAGGGLSVQDRLRIQDCDDVTNFRP